jgi:DNA ligase-1
MTFKPMLAGKFDAEKLRFPALASPKLDGVRATVRDGQMRSRSLKPLGNVFTQQLYSMPMFSGLDGELILGDPTAKDVYRKTNQAIATNTGTPKLTWFVFDSWLHPGTFAERLRHISAVWNADNEDAVFHRIVPLKHVVLNDAEDLARFEAMCVDCGYEGIMLRDPEGQYKYGRSSTNEGGLLKVKRFEDAEAIVVGVEEEMHNGNEAETNELGRTKRSSAKAGKVGKGTMGALVVRGVGGAFDGVEFNIGTGFDAADRAREWPIGEMVKFKYFAVGVKDKPRHPVYLGSRMAKDVSA